MGADLGTFSRGTLSRKPPELQASSDAGGLGVRTVDSENGRTMAPAASVLSPLQDRASSVSAVVRRRGLDERERFIDATFASADGIGDGIGKSRRSKSIMILAIADRHRLPLSVSTHAANHHAVTLVHGALTRSLYHADCVKLRTHIVGSGPVPRAFTPSF